MTSRTIPADDTPPVTMTSGQLRELVAFVTARAVADAGALYAQAGADAALRDLEARGLLRAKAPVRVTRVHPDADGLITAMTETRE
jgi:hypothetical protein